MERAILPDVARRVDQVVYDEEYDLGPVHEERYQDSKDDDDRAHHG